jgi:hypothetical protein
MLIIAHEDVLIFRPRRLLLRARLAAGAKRAER